MEQECIPVGCVPSAAGGVCLGGVCPGAECLPGGVSAQGGMVCIPSCTEADIPPVNRMTDRCKNITLPQASFADGNYQ